MGRKEKCCCMKSEPYLPIWIIVAVFALGTGVITGKMFNPNWWAVLGNPLQIPTYQTHQAGLYMHIVGAILMMLLGPIQLLKTIRRRNINAHRVIGYIYYVLLYPASAGAYWLAFYAYGGVASTIGFMILATLWVATGFLAYKAINEKRVNDHKEWMLRNYALTMAAFTLRILVIIDSIVGDSEIGYILISYFCWIINLVVIELWIQFVERKDRKNASSKLPKNNDSKQDAQLESSVSMDTPSQ